jgi:hypothetical protein
VVSVGINSIQKIVKKKMELAVFWYGRVTVRVKANGKSLKTFKKQGKDYEIQEM